MIPPALFQVGDVVTVGSDCMSNPAGSRAVVVEVYDREAIGIGQGIGVLLLFQNGAFDGFGPDDRELWDVVRVEHRRELDDYLFMSAGRLYAEWQRGLFAEVWT